MLKPVRPFTDSRRTVQPSQSPSNSHLGLGFLNFLVSYGVWVAREGQLCQVRDAATARRTLRLTYVMGKADMTSASRGSGIADRAPVFGARTHWSGALLRQFVRVDVTMGACVALVFFAVVYHRYHLVDPCRM